MGLLNNVLGSTVPGGSLAKPLGIALLAYLASRSGNNPAASGGGFGGLLSGGLGGLLGGLLGGSGAGMGSATLPADEDQAHSAVSGGLGELLQRFQQNGYGNVAGSWVGTGPNQSIAPHELQQALGPETVDDLSEQTGVPRNDLLSQLSQAQPTTTNSTMPQRQTYSNWRQTMTPSRETRMPTRQTMNANQFSTESDARGQCGSDTVVWVNTKSHVYHFPGSREFGQTKRGAFMCQADADRAGTFRAAKNEMRMQGSTQRSLGSGSSMNRLGAGAGR